MNSSRISLVAVVCISVAIGAIGVRGRCVRSQDRASIQSYLVPGGRAEEVKNELNRLFNGPGKGDGNAQVVGDELLIVKASEQYQSGVARLVEQVGSQRQVAARPIRIEYWMVEGEETETERSAKGVAPVEMNDLLQSIAKAEGPRRFSILEHMSVNSVENRESYTRGSLITSLKTFIRTVARTPVNIGGNAVNGELKLRAEGRGLAGLGEWMVDTVIKPGEYVLLSENAMDARADPSARTGKKLESEGHKKQVYTIVRAQML